MTLIARDPNRAREEMAARERGTRLPEAAAKWPRGCMELDPTKPGRTDERCCRRASKSLVGVPLCDPHWRARVGGST